MKIEDRLRRELSDTAEHLALDTDTYEHVLEMGRRRKRSRLLAAATGTVAIGAAVIGMFSLLSPGPPGAIVSSSTTATSAAPIVTSTTTPPPGIPAMNGVLLATPDQGIIISGFDGTSGRLASDPYYEGIAWVISDAAGGIYFQHEVTPLPWPQGTILRLPAGASNPIAVVEPDPGTYIRPIDTDSGLLLYRVDTGGTSEVRAIDPATDVIHTVVPPTEFLIGAAAEEGTVVSAVGGDCPGLEVYGIDGSAQALAWEAGECQGGFISDVAYSGGFIYTIEDGEGRNLVRRDFGTGAASFTPLSDAWALATLPDGTVAFGGTDIVVGSFDGDVFVETSRVRAASTFTLAAVDGFAAGATLGSGTGELPCTPIAVPAPASQGLPPAVEAAKVEIFEMAASCDLAGLSEKALAHGTAFTYGGETDPLRSWVRSARNGFDVMAWIVRIFNATPAADETQTYAWPAVHVTNSDADWDELSGILSAAEFEQYSQYRDGGWLGLRIGIGLDGTWRYVIAGD